MSDEEKQHFEKRDDGSWGDDIPLGSRWTGWDGAVYKVVSRHQECGVHVCRLDGTRIACISELAFGRTYHKRR